jgi:hypothetical protein
MLQGGGVAGMNMPVGCSAHIQTWLQDVPVHALTTSMAFLLDVLLVKWRSIPQFGIH